MVVRRARGIMEQIKGMDAFQMAELMRKSCRETNDTAKAGVQTNYYGVKNVTEALLPLLLQASSSGGGRVVNVSSDFGLLRVSKLFRYLIIPFQIPFLSFDQRQQLLLLDLKQRMQYLRNEEVKHELDDIEGLTEERLDELLSTFLRDFEAGALKSRGWPTEFAAYKVAKAALNSYSRVLARRHPELRVNCAHPGYVKTDMTRQTGLLTPAQGAANVVKVALLPEGGPTGAFFALGKEAPFV
jgi:(+)-neomenthol dehydrogenase